MLYPALQSAACYLFKFISVYSSIKHESGISNQSYYSGFISFKHNAHFAFHVSKPPWDCVYNSIMASVTVPTITYRNDVNSQFCTYPNFLWQILRTFWDIKRNCRTRKEQTHTEARSCYVREILYMATTTYICIAAAL